MFRTRSIMLKEQNDVLRNDMHNVSKQNKSLETEVEKFRAALVVKDLQKDLDHSEEKHKLKDKLIKVLEERPKDVKVEVQQPVYGNGYSVLDNNTTSTSITTTANGSAGFLR